MSGTKETLETAIARIALIKNPNHILSEEQPTHATLNDIQNAAAILGIDITSDEESIKKSYKTLSVLLHPDKNPDNTAAADAFIKVNNAHELMIEKIRNNILIINTEQEARTTTRRQHTETTRAQTTPPSQPPQPSFIPPDIDAKAKDAELYTLYSLTNPMLRLRAVAGHPAADNCIVEVYVKREDGSPKTIRGFITFYDKNTNTIDYISLRLPGPRTFINNPSKAIDRIFRSNSVTTLKLEKDSIPEIIKIHPDLRSEIDKRIHHEIEMRAEQEQATRARAQASQTKPSATDTEPTRVASTQITLSLDGSDAAQYDKDQTTTARQARREARYERQKQREQDSIIENGSKDIIVSTPKKLPDTDNIAARQARREARQARREAEQMSGSVEDIAKQLAEKIAHSGQRPEDPTKGKSSIVTHTYAQRTEQATTNESIQSDEHTDRSNFKPGK